VATIATDGVTGVEKVEMPDPPPVLAIEVPDDGAPIATADDAPAEVEEIVHADDGPAPTPPPKRSRRGRTKA